MKLSFDRVLAIIVCAYLFVAIPLAVLEMEQKELCLEICGKAEGGFDIVIEARGLFEVNICNCLSSITRERIEIEVG